MPELALGDELERISLMSPEGAQAAWDTFRNAVGMLDLFDWKGVREKMDWTHSVGHILDPTVYKEMIYSDTVADNLKLAQAAETFLSTVRGIAEEARARAQKVKANASR